VITTKISEAEGRRFWRRLPYFANPIHQGLSHRWLGNEPRFDRDIQSAGSIENTREDSGNDVLEGWDDGLRGGSSDGVSGGLDEGLRGCCGCRKAGVDYALAFGKNPPKAFFSGGPTT